MFKIIALVGAIAGGATYALYTHTDLFGDSCIITCPLAAEKSCCEGKAATAPPCCPSSDSTISIGSDECCEATKAATAASNPACCLTQASIKKPSACCATLCPECETGCGAEAKTAVAGPAGALAGVIKK